MSTPFDGAGLTLDQAPPLAVPARFFVIAPLAVIAAGALLLLRGQAALLSPWLPDTAALTHLGTLGFLGAVMLGALYQMIPVVAASRVPGVRLAGLVWVLWVIGAASLVGGLLGAPLLWPAMASLGVAGGIFVGQVGVALVRAPANTDTVWGMRLALVALVAVVAVGLALAWGHLVHSPPADRVAWVRAHLVLGVLGWVGGLLVAVSWQVVPMFYLARETPRWARWTTLGLLVAGLLAAGLSIAGLPAAAPGVALAGIAVWGVHPVVTLWAIRGRRRRRRDASLTCWVLGLWAGLALLPLGGMAWLSDDPRWVLIFGFVAAWGWAGMIVRGMLGRIVPFLVWFHRFSHRLGDPGVPTMRELLPMRQVNVATALHLLSLALGVAAIALRSDALARATGAALAAVGVALLVEIVGVLIRRAPAPAG